LEDFIFGLETFFKGLSRAHISSVLSLIYKIYIYTHIYVCSGAYINLYLLYLDIFIYIYKQLFGTLYQTLAGAK
jgi:hypothetical protein